MITQKNEETVLKEVLGGIEEFIKVHQLIVQCLKRDIVIVEWMLVPGECEERNVRECLNKLLCVSSYKFRYCF